jgi:tetratricopeptide (TPR) repeat protein
VIPTGFVLAERTLFLASGGVMLGIAATGEYLTRSGRSLPGQIRTLGFAAVGVVLALGLTRSSLRQRVWRDNDTLFTQTVDDVPASYKAHLWYASVLFGQNRRSDAFEEIRLAHALFPKDPSVLEYEAEEYSRAGRCEKAIAIFRDVLAEYPARQRSLIGLSGCLIAVGQYAEAKKTINQGFATGFARHTFEQLLAVSDSVEAIRRARER